MRSTAVIAARMTTAMRIAAASRDELARDLLRRRSRRGRWVSVAGSVGDPS